MISRGCARRNWSSGKPSLAVAPGLRFCTNTSALASMRRQHGLVVVAREIEHQRFLAAVEPDEIRALAVTLGGIRAFTPVLLRNKLARLRQLVVAAGEVALGPLDLDHARAGIGEAAGAHRRRHRLLERNDEKAGQGKGHGKATRRGFGAVILEHIDTAHQATRASFAPRGGAAILGPNRNAVFIVEAHGPHCHHCAAAARDVAGAGRAGATGGAAASCRCRRRIPPHRRPAAAAPAEQNAATPPAATPAALGCRSARIRVPDDRGVGAGAQPAARILRAGDLAGEPVPARRGRPAHAQRRARPGHRPVHAAHRGGARPARSVRPGAGAAEIGRVPARARRPVRQSRLGGGRLQCRPAAGARLALRPAHLAGGDAATTCRPSPGSRPTSGRGAASASRCSRRGRTARS